MVLTERHLHALAVAPKPSAAISFLSCLYIVFSVALCPHRRRRLYHRICLAMALNGLILSAAFFWGTWAIPSEMEEIGYADMARGNWNTCEAQGFLIQYGFAVPCYYASLSLYSLLAVRNNFDQAKLAKYELWIHLICNAAPLATAVVLQTKGMINPGGAWCWMARYPPDCQGDQCERGGNVRSYMWGLGYGVMFFNLGFATFMMGVLYWTIQQRERAGRVCVRGKMEVLEKAKRARSRMVLCQAWQYLAAFYATYVMSIASRLVEAASGELNPTLHIISVTILPLQGFFYFLVYARLRISRSEDSGKMRLSIVPNSLRRVSVRRLSLTKGLSEAILNMTRTTYGQSQWGLRASTVQNNGNGNDTGTGATGAASSTGDNNPGSNNRGSVISRLSGSSRKEFSIFDGANCGADSIWAQFLVDGYDEDEDGADEGLADLEFDQVGIGEGLKVPLEGKTPEVPSHEEYDSDGPDDRALPSSVPAAQVQGGNDTSGTSGMTTESSGLFADSTQTPDSSTAQPLSVRFEIHDNEMELVSDPIRAKEPNHGEPSPSTDGSGQDGTKLGMSKCSSKSLV